MTNDEAVKAVKAIASVISESVELLVEWRAHARATQEALRAVRAYAQHKPDCWFLKENPPPGGVALDSLIGCTCGLSDLLASLVPEQEQP